jgi:hypothetical protein
VGVDAEQEIAQAADLLVARGVEGDLPGQRDPVAMALLVIVQRVEEVAGEDGVLVVDEGLVGEEVAGRADLVAVGLRHAEVEQREERVVIAALRLGLDALGHLLDDRVDALDLARRAVVGAVGVVGVRQPGKQLGPVEDQVVGAGGRGKRGGAQGARDREKQTEPDHGPTSVAPPLEPVDRITICSIGHL